MSNALDSIKEYATIAFTLLGVLFGMMIMTFIFGQIGTANVNLLSDNTVTVINLTETHINGTTFTIPEATDINYNGGFTVISAINATNGAVITSATYTLNIAAGTLINSTIIDYPEVNLSYSFSAKTPAKLGAEETQNNSLNAIVTYTEGADTQFSTVSIAIILVLLIGVFLLFWKIFVSQKQGKGSSGGGSFGA